MTKIKLGVLFGGRSGEHEVSLMSATSVISAVNKDRFQVIPIGITREGRWLLYEGDIENIENGLWEKDAVEFTLESLKDRIDFALPILHGTYGEDGTIQGMFEMLRIPYGGCGVTGSALAMDKILAKTIFAQAGLPQGSFTAVLREELEEEMDKVLDRVESAVSYPIFVKPANLGSSVGITKVKNRDQLEQALLFASQFDGRIVAEQGIDCREMETAVLGNYRPKVSVVGEIIPSAEFYNYQAKYFDGGKSKLCIPADISEKTADEIRELARKAFELLDCSGFARVDFFLERGTNKVYINEVNTIPGFTKFSMFPLLWEQAGLPYPELIERIVMLGYEKYNAKNRRKTNIRIDG